MYLHVFLRSDSSIFFGALLLLVRRSQSSPYCLDDGRTRGSESPKTSFCCSSADRAEASAGDSSDSSLSLLLLLAGFFVLICFLICLLSMCLCRQKIESRFESSLHQVEKDKSVHFSTMVKNRHRLTTTDSLTSFFDETQKKENLATCSL